MWFHLLRPVILARKALIGIMVVGIALAAADGLQWLGRRIQDMQRRHQRSGFLRAPPALLLSHVGRIRFGRAGEIEAGLDDADLALRRAEEIVHLLRR